MKKMFMRVTACCLAVSVTAVGFSFEADASSLSSLLPVAGIARVLNEGKSVTAVKADKIKISTPGNQPTSLISVSAGNVPDETKASEENTESTIKEMTASTDPAILTVGAASITASENTEPQEAEESDEGGSEEIVIGEEDSLPAEESAEETDAANTREEERKAEEESFRNLVIAQVNDYVNVRAEASEESEIVGKLYNHSVGDLLETEGDWIKITSGNTTGYVKGEYVVTGEEAVALAKEVGVRMAVVTTTTLYVREAPSTGAAVIGMVPIEDELTVSEEIEGWARVSIEEGDGYVSTDYVRLYTDFVRAESKAEEEARLAKEEAERKAAREAAEKAAAKNKTKSSRKSGSSGGASYSASGSGTGASVANFALQFVGNPYVYGGTSLTNGADCSGFVMSVYRNFGVSLPHSSGGDRSVGYDVGGLGNAQAGDIVCYSGHVGIYIGNGQIVHASTAATGIKVSSANYRNVLAVRRIF